MAKVTIFDCDGHCAEPLDIWDRYVDAKHRKRAKETMAIKRIPGYGSGFWVEGRMLQPGTQAVTWAGKDPIDFFGKYWEEGEPSALDPKLRIKTMDSEGIALAVLYPSFGGTIGGVKDPETAAILSRAYNTWVVDFSKQADPKRVFGVAIVPLQDVSKAIQELRYAVKNLGLRSVMVRPNSYSGKHLDHLMFDPFWAEAQELDVAVGFHPFPFPDVEGVNTMVGELERVPNSSSMMGDLAGLPMDNMLTMARLMLGGVMDKFPRMRCAFLESNGSWAAMWVDRMEKRFKRRSDSRHVSRVAQTKPSELVKRQCFIALDGDEAALTHTASLIGEDVIIWASDFPHFDGKFPGAAAEALEHSEPLGARIQQKFLGTNASRLYKIPLPVMA